MATNPETRKQLQTRSWFAVVNAYQTCEQQYARLLAGFRLSIAQFEVLSVICDLHEHATPARIAECLLVTKGNITGLLKRLREQAWIRVQANPDDGRSQLCRLTPRAVQTLAEARHASAAFIAEQLAPFSDSQLRATESQMTRMRLHLAQIDTQALVQASRRAHVNATGADGALATAVEPAKRSVTPVPVRASGATKAKKGGDRVKSDR